MKTLRSTIRAFAVVFASLILPLASAQVQTLGRWQTLTNTMPINPVHVALTHDGNVLVVSGSGNLPSNTNWQAGVYTPSTGNITLQPVAWDMFCNGMVILPDGRPFIVSGTLQYDPFHGIVKTSSFDPATGAFNDLQDLAHGRWYPSVTTLGDGRIMTFSGLSETGSTNTTVEIYTVGSGWSPEYTAPFTPPLYPRMHLLPNGKVFYAGSTTSSRYFDPSTDTWSGVVATTNYSGNRTYGSSVLFPLMPSNNYAPKVMILGGGNPATATTEIIDLSAANPTWIFGPPMSQSRIEMNATILPNGKILATGGSLNDEDKNTASLNADLYDPATNTFSSAGANAFPRLYHSNALLLPDATVLVVGGNPARGQYEPHIEIYSPAYLFNPDGTSATRPTITSVPQMPIGYGAQFQVQTPDTSSIASAVLMRPGVVTHAFNWEQRMVGLTFSVVDGTTLNITSPPNGNIAPPGYYLLFLLNSAGVPSVAQFVQISSNPTAAIPKGSIDSPTTNQSISTGQSIFFSGSGTEANGTITGYSWTFPGANPTTSSLETPGNITYPTPGTYVASLTVTGSSGATDPSPPTRTIVVQGPATISSVTLSPATVTSGNPSTGTVTLSAAAPAGGLTATLLSGNTEVATVPSTVTVPAGSISVTFPVVTKVVGSPGTAKITASDLSSSASATLTSIPATAGGGGPSIDAQTNAKTASPSSSITTPAFSTSMTNELLLAFVATDYVSGPNTIVTGVNGGGLAWNLVVRTNSQSGSSEIWRAFATSPLSNATVTASLSQSVVSSLQVISFSGVDATGTNGSGAIGATKSASAGTGAPTATIVTTRNNSWVFAVGNDFDNAIARTLGPAQTLVNQYLTPTGDTHWMQCQTNVTPLSGTSVTINDTAPTSDRYNLSVVEVLPSGVPSYSISGSVTPSAKGTGTHLTLSGSGSAVVTADASGNYSFTGFSNGSYIVTPSKAGFSFTPASQSVTVEGANFTSVNFVSKAVTTYSISGTISPASSGSGATIALGGSATASTTIDVNGNYTFAGLANGSYMITPAKTGFAFTPSSQPVTVNGASVTAVDFSSPVVLSITGNIGGPGGTGATVFLAGSSIASTTADASGNYSFTDLVNGSYTVTPANAGYVFSPGSQPITLNAANATANFTSAVATYSISGTISGGGGPGATVVLTGTSTSTATADTFGNFTFTGLLNGSYIVTVGNTGYVFTPASADVVIAGASYTGTNIATLGGCPTCDTVWPASAAPTVTDGGDPTSMELGVKIRADSDGYITGLRFYKAPNNTGTHVVHVWSSTGTLVGSTTVTGESAAGWQQMMFTAPVPMVANTTYVASYLAPLGHYSADANFFSTTGADNAPLHALANGVDGPSGMYLATTTGGFPTSTNQSTNYWVDVVYSNTQGYSIVGNINGPGGSGATVNLTGAATASTTADANGNFSFNNLANGSYTVTPSNGNDTFNPANQAVTINSAHAMGVNFTSASYSLSGTISGPGGPGASVNLSGASTATTTADGSGNYTFTGLANGSYTIAPSDGSYIFTPLSQSTTISSANVSAFNFSSVAPTYSLSGIISGPGGPGAMVSLSGASAATTTADGSGNYTFTGLANGSYTIAPSDGSYLFTPASQSTTISGANVSAFNFGSLAVTSVVLNPSSVIGGGSSTGTVTLSAPAPASGAAVALLSNNTAAAQVSSSINVSPGATTATFIITTSPVAANASLTISATLGSTQTAGFTVSAPVPGSVVLNPTSVIGGTSSTGTVTLTGPAPSGGAVVTLSSSNTGAAQAPISVTVAAGVTTATFTITTSGVASNASVTISGAYGATKTATLTVTAAALASVTRSPSTPVIGGTSSTGIVTLTGPAPSGGAVVTLSSSNTAAAQVPPSVTVGAGATTATFTITTSAVASNVSVTISGTYGATKGATLTVTAAALTSVGLNPTSVIGGASSTGTVVLSGPAPTAGAVVTLTSSNTAAAQAPTSVTVAGGATTATFTITTSWVASNASVAISGAYGATKTATLTVTAAALASVTRSPSTPVIGGTSSTGIVTLTGPAPSGGAVVTLSSSNTAAAQVPPSVTVGAGATTATFTITTSAVASNVSVTISGTYGATKGATLTVTAAALTSVGLNPTSVIGGASSTGTVVLSGPAPTAGAVVTLTSSNTAAAQAPTSVTVAGGATTATFTITTSWVASNASVAISGAYGATKTATLTVTAAALTSVTRSPSTPVIGGTSSTGIVTLTGPAPSGGAVVTLSSSNTAAAQVPPSVTVGAGATTATFTITTSAVASNVSVTISGAYGATKTATLTVTAAALTSVTRSPSTPVIGGTSSTGIVTLTGPAPSGGAVVTLSSSNTAAAQVPPSVTVGGGATTATFTITTSAVASNVSVTISGTYGATKGATLTVTAAALTSVGLNPTSVIGGA